MSVDPNQAKSIFLSAVEDHSPEQWSAYLDEACRGDAELRRRVETLLAAHQGKDSLLDDPDAVRIATIGPAEPTEGPGTVVGRYKLLEKIGEGGMALVYMAEQTEPIRRKVALKIIKLGMDTRQVIARFEAERQALALMDHPSIAKVLDAGATETGRPYFVMELVQGVSITEYCDKNNLSTKDRLALFLQVCNAVQHAHQKGIIHRDIKPSNVMVTHHDGKPVPKVIDFGIAKATNQKLTEKTLFTRYAHIIGTPAYMSPEQAELSDLDIDTRSDIYSLGVLLYELLTGTTPFSEEELRKAGYIEMQRVIREQEPAKPSTKLSTLGDTLTDIAKRRGCTPDLLRRAIRGDLDWIVMKSLEKDRLRRYEAAEDLASDIQRHLEHRAVSARAPSTAYRLRKFLWRHRLSVVGGLVLALLAGALASALLMWNHNRLRLVEGEVIRDRDALSQARMRSAMTEYEGALEILEPLLGTKYVAGEAHLLHNQIQEAVRGRIGDCTREIEANPQNAAAYSHRAQYYACLGDRANANADMRRWSAIMSQRVLADSWFAAIRGSRHVIGMPFDCQIVFSAERPTNEIPVLCIAFGQKGRWEMKLFEIPMFVASLLSFGLLSGLDMPVAHADFVFGEPVNLGPAINTPAIDYSARISLDGLSLFFWRQTSPDSLPEPWLATRATKEDPWGTPVSLGRWGDAGAVYSSIPIVPNLTSMDGLEIYFNDLDSLRPGYGNLDLWMMRRERMSADWGPPINLGPLVNSAADEMCPAISSDGLEVYFSEYTVARPGGCGESDIWVAKRATKNDPWGEPVNLGPTVNSASYDTRPSLSPDGLLLFFDSQRPGGYGQGDLYVTRRATRSSPWGKSVNLGPGINTPAFEQFVCVSADGSTLYWDSARPGGYGNQDIWQASITPIVDFNGDGKVDGKEVLAMAGHWGQKDLAHDIGPTPMGDGVVDTNDLTVLAGYIGQEVNDPSLIAHWALDETEGLTATDSAGDNDAMVLGGATWQPAGGRIGGAVALDGKDDFVRSGSVVLDPAKGPLSVIAWVKGGAPNKVIVSQASGADWLYLNQYGMLTTGLSDGSRSAKSLTSDAFVTDDQWHRVVLTWDGTNRTLQMDGVEVARDTQPSLAASSGSLHIGAGKNLGITAFWSGLIDDVRIYNRAVAP